MLAQTCPMTTLTVVNVDAVDRPAAPGVHDCRRRERSCKIAKVQCPTRTSQFRAKFESPILARTRPTGDPQGQAALRTARPSCWRPPARGPILARWGSSGIRSKEHPGQNPRGGQLDSAQDHRNIAKPECPMTTWTLVNVDTGPPGRQVGFLGGRW